MASRVRRAQKDYAERYYVVSQTKHARQADDRYSRLPMTVQLTKYLDHHQQEDFGRSHTMKPSTQEKRGLRTVPPR